MSSPADLAGSVTVGVAPSTVAEVASSADIAEVAPSADLGEVASSADLAGDVTVGVSSPADLAGGVTVGVAPSTVTEVASSTDLAENVTVGVSSLADLAVFLMLYCVSYLLLGAGFLAGGVEGGPVLCF